jgi:hypothetical protein
MIKHFNTALSAGASSGTGKKGGVGTIVVIGVLAALAYFGYKYVVTRNQPVIANNED